MIRFFSIISFIGFIVWTLFTACCVVWCGLGYIGSFGNFHLDSLIICLMIILSLGLFCGVVFLVREDR